MPKCPRALLYSDEPAKEGVPGCDVPGMEGEGEWMKCPPTAVSMGDVPTPDIDDAVLEARWRNGSGCGCTLCLECQRDAVSQWQFTYCFSMCRSSRSLR